MVVDHLRLSRPSPYSKPQSRGPREGAVKLLHGVITLLSWIVEDMHIFFSAVGSTSSQ